LQVEAQVADVEQALGRLRGVLADEREPAQQHLDARHELAGGERLAQVVIGSELETEHAVELLVARGQEDDRQLIGAAAQPPAQLEAVHARHHDVEDGEIG
jgi:hypothetical protein